MVRCGDGQTARAGAGAFRMIEKYEENKRGTRRTWSFINLTKRLPMDVSCFVCTQISTPEYTQNFKHLAPSL